MVNLVKHPVSDAESAENIYLNRLIVFVEGMSDVEIFIRLFPDREDEIRFRTPSQETNGDGCIAVINRVAQERTDRSNPGRCIGIVDRDIYFSMKEWDILFEIDDEKYRSECNLGEGIKPLIYWEIENYLLIPEVISAVLSDLNKNVDHIESDIEYAIGRLIRINAANCVIHENNITSIPHGFLLNKCDDESFASLIEKQVRDRLIDQHEINKIEDFVCRHEKFNERSIPEQYLERSMRIVPGKALISFIAWQYRVRESMDRLLAKQIRLSDKIHPHLIEDIEGSLASAYTDGSVASPPAR